MTRGNLSLAIPVVALLMLGLGVVNEPTNAYAFGTHCSAGETSWKAPPVVTSIVPTIDGVIIEGTQAELDADFFFFWHLDCDFPTFFEVEVDDVAPVNSPFIFEDETIPGGDSFEYTVEGLECGTDYVFDVDGIWDTHLFGGKHIDGADHEFTTLACEEETDKNGGSCTQCQTPSLGIDDRGQRVVDGGITVNGETYDALNYHTPTELIQANLFTQNTVILKIWDDRLDNIKHVLLGFGIGKIGESFSQVEHSIIYNRNLMDNSVEITHDDYFKNVKVTRLADEPCREGGVPCTVIKFQFQVTKPIVGDVVFGTDIWDKYNNADTHFFNDGMQFGTEADIVVEEPVDMTVHKVQLRTDDGLGDVDNRDSEAFKMKHAWHNAQIEQLVADLGY